MTEISEAMLRAAGVAHDRCAEIARQLRCSTGFSQGRVPVAPRPRAAAMKPAPSEPPPGAAQRLLAWLRTLPPGTTLPAAPEIAAEIGIGGTDTSRQVRGAIRRLAESGVIVTIAGDGGGVWGGQRVILLVAEDLAFLSAKAPRNWAEIVRRGVVA